MEDSKDILEDFINNLREGKFINDVLPNSPPYNDTKEIALQKNGALIWKTLQNI